MGAWPDPAGFKSLVCTYLDVCGVKYLGVELEHNLCILLSDIWKDDFWNVSWRDCTEDPAETGSWCFIVWGCCSSEIGTAIYTEVYFHVPSTHDIALLIFVGYTQKKSKINLYKGAHIFAQPNPNMLIDCGSTWAVYTMSSTVHKFKNRKFMHIEVPDWKLKS